MALKQVLIVGAALVGTTAFAGTAMAGACGIGTNCSIGIDYLRGPQAHFDNMTVRATPPMGHLRSVDFQRAPNVSITRVHGLPATAALSDAPSGFTNGCHPQSTTYCRADAGVPVNVEFTAPVQQPVYQQPVYQAPVMQAPQPELRTWVGGGYDPSKFAPRVYGDATFVPGIVHAPTSIVDRDPGRAQAALDMSGGGITPAMAGLGQVPGATIPAGAPNPYLRGGYGMQSGYGMSYGGSAPMMQAPMMSAPMMQAPMMQAPVMQAPVMQAPVYQAPQMQPMMMGAPSYGQPQTLQPQTPSLQADGTYASPVASDGTYWEKTSGLTTFGSTVATQVICKRKLPTRVVNPVVGVPTAVPTPVPTYCN